VLSFAPAFLKDQPRVLYLEEVILRVGLDGAIRRRVRHAGQGEASRELVVVEERLLGVVHFAGFHLACAGGARAGAARVGQVDAGLLRHVEDVLVTRGVDGL